MLKVNKKHQNDVIDIVLMSFVNSEHILSFS